MASRVRDAALAAGLASSLLLGGCEERVDPAGKRGRTGMMRMMAGERMELPEGIPAKALPEPGSRGAQLVAKYCGQCHGIPSPRRHAAEDWHATVRRMVRRMAHMERMGERMGRGRMRGMRGHRMMEVEAPSAEEERRILAYLERHALEPARPEVLPAGEGRASFQRACSRCHALPAPAQHRAAEWPAVVERMKENMERMEVEPLSEGEAERIVRYLQQGASPSEG